MGGQRRKQVVKSVTLQKWLPSLLSFGFFYLSVENGATVPQLPLWIGSIMKVQQAKVSLHPLIFCHTCMRDQQQFWEKEEG